MCYNNAKCSCHYTAAKCLDKPLDLTKPIQTKDGLKARVLCTDLKTTDGPRWVVAIANTHGEGIYHYQPGGKYVLTPHSMDLVNVAEKIRVQGWLNVYKTPRYGNDSGNMIRLHPTRGEADKYASNNRTACVYIDQEADKI